MRLMKEGMSGDDVLRWQQFLRGQFPAYAHSIVTNGTFDNWTTALTKVFEKSCGLVSDGSVGNAELAFAAARGFPIVDVDPSGDRNGPSWPAKPANVSFLDDAARAKLFGEFRYVAAPTQMNAEGIRILDGWAEKNITVVNIQQLKRIQSPPNSASVPFNAKLVAQVQALWAAWENANLLDRVLTWNGSFVPRFVRGSRTNLSNHSWGTAFDINIPWNVLGTQPALVGQKGCVRELVEIAVKFGFVWGGWFSRMDGMHMECFKVL